jgi:hypothetical protein
MEQTTVSISENRKRLAAPLVSSGMAILAFCWTIVHGLLVAAGNIRTISDWTYDDAYYYFVTAHYLASQGVSTFDGGRTLHSGYHFLWMAICTLDALVFGDLDLRYLRSLMLLSLLVSAITAGAVIAALIKARDEVALIVLAVMLTSYSALNNSISAMEWPVVVAIGTAYSFTLLRLDRIIPARAAAIAVLLGFLGSWARSDFGLFFGSFWLSSLILRRGPVPRRRLRLTFTTAGLAGAIVGLVALFAANFAMTGEFLQTSARMKSLYSIGGLRTSPIPVLWQFARALFYLPPLQIDQGGKQMLVFAAERAAGSVAFAIAAAAAIFLWVPRALEFLKKSGDRLKNVVVEIPEEWHLPILASLIGLCGYIVLYSDATAVFGWYTANVTVFIFILTYVLFRMVAGLLGPVTPILLAIAVIIVNTAVMLAYGGTAPEQTVNVMIGEYLRDSTRQGLTAAAGDAGKIGFFAGGRVINVDGLVNDQIFRYVVQGRLHCYLLDAKVDLITGFGQAGRSNDAVRRRNGNPERLLDDYTEPTVVPLIRRVRFDVLRAYPECGPHHSQGS